MQLSRANPRECADVSDRILAGEIFRFAKALLENVVYSANFPIITFDGVIDLLGRIHHEVVCLAQHWTHRRILKDKPL